MTYLFIFFYFIAVILKRFEEKTHIKICNQSTIFNKILVTIFFFLLYCRACGILVPQPGIKPMPPALAAWSLNSNNRNAQIFTIVFPCISKTDTKHLLQRGFAEWMIKSPITIMRFNISPFLKLVSRGTLEKSLHERAKIYLL